MLTVAPVTNETWLICGGRRFNDQAMFDSVMSQLVGLWGVPKTVVHGAALGADRMAGAWANRLAINVVAMPAQWSEHGKAAGPIRNEAMLLEHKPNRVIAFPGGKGTADMARCAKQKPSEIDLVEVVPATPTSINAPKA